MRTAEGTAAMPSWHNLDYVGTIPITAVLYSNTLAQIRGTVHHIWLPGATKNKKLNKIIDHNKAYNQ